MSSRSDLERQVLESLTADSMAWILGLKRTTFLSRNPPKADGGGYSARDVVVWLIDAIDDAHAVAPGQVSPELERLRRYRADGAAFDLAVRRGELRPVATINAMHERSFAILHQWAHRVAGDHPDVFRTYRQAVRHAIEEAGRFVMRPGCQRILRLIPEDGSAPIEIDLGVATEGDIELPVEDRKIRRCQKCNGELYPSWTIEDDGTETPVWACHTLNCLVRLPRHVAEDETL